MKRPVKKEGRRAADASPSQPQTEVLFGVHPVREALFAGRRRFESILIGRDSGSGPLLDICRAAESGHIPIENAPRSYLDKIAGQTLHQGVLAMVSPFPAVDMETFHGRCLGKGAAPFFLILDTIVDTQNLGALIRTALCAGVTGMILPKDRSVKPSPAVSKASSGAMEHAVIGIATNISVAIDELKSAGVWVSGLDAQAETSVYDSDLTGPLALVVGGEEKGIRPLVRKQCDFLVSIPQKGPIDSLNASVAGAVVMYEAVRQRLKMK